LQFDLTGYDPASASLSGVWGADNFGNVLFNGATPGGSGNFSLVGINPANFNVGHNFSITSGFVSGVNRLDFVVTDGGNPGGLNVNSLTLAAAPVPEPQNLSLLLAGLAMLGGVTRHRVRQRRRV
jgi:hypothetical protein